MKFLINTLLVFLIFTISLSKLSSIALVSKSAFIKELLGGSLEETDQTEETSEKNSDAFEKEIIVHLSWYQQISNFWILSTYHQNIKNKRYFFYPEIFTPPPEA